MQPPDLLQWLSLGQKTGTLVISGKEVEKRIFFRRGRILSSASTNPREYLGQFLMSHGYITEDELKKAMEVQGQSKILLGKILVMIHAISEEDLIRLMRLKAEEEIYDVFLWPEADFHFVDDELPTMELIPLQVDVTGIILEGTRRVDEWKRLRSVIPSTDLIPVIDMPIDVEQFSEVQRMVLQSVNGRRSVDEIILESRASHFIVAETICECIGNGTMHLLEAREVASPDQASPDQAPPGQAPPGQASPAQPPPGQTSPDQASPDQTAPEPVAAGPVPARPAAPPDQDGDDEIAALLARAQTQLRARDYEKALRILKAAQNLDPNNPTVRSALKGAETMISTELKREGILEAKVPKIAKTFEEITSLNFTPNEGFILSRINGTWDLGSIIKISPMREIDALLIFNRLLRDGIISF